MTESDLAGLYALTHIKIQSMVRDDSIGVYVLYHSFPSTFGTVYVGRTDGRPVRERLLEHASDGEYRDFRFKYCSKKREAYEAECLLWHALAPLLPQRHPEKPDGKNWPCPRPNCDK